MAKTKTLIILAALLSLAACSIKEDRTPCPCWLSINFTRVSQKNVNVAAWGEDELFSERIAVKDYQETESYEKTVPKGYVYTSVVSGERDAEKRSPAHHPPRTRCGQHLCTCSVSGMPW